MTSQICPACALLTAAALAAVLAVPAAAAEGDGPQIGVLRGGSIGAPVIGQRPAPSGLPVDGVDRVRLLRALYDQAWLDGWAASYPWYPSYGDSYRYAEPYFQPYPRPQVYRYPQPYPYYSYYGDAHPQQSALPQYFGDPSPYTGVVERYGTPLTPTDGGAEGDSTGEQCRAAARRAVESGDYRAALRWATDAAADMSGDAQSRELLSLCQFAVADYRAAAAEARAAAELEQPGNTAWIRHYTKSKAYRAQFQALERFVRDNPRSADGHFLLGYHCLILGKRALAKEHLKQCLALAPGDEVAQRLMK